MADAVFPEGIRINEKNANAPDFVICGVSLERDKLIEWLKQQPEEKIRLDIKRSRGGKLYSQVYVPRSSGGGNNQQNTQSSRPNQQNQSKPGGDFDDDIPF